MTTLHIDEYNAKDEVYSRTRGCTPNTVYRRLVKTQNQITTSGASQQSNAVQAETTFVCIRPIGGNVYIKIGNNPTASNSPTGGCKFLLDGDPWDIDVNPGDRIAVIDA